MRFASLFTGIGGFELGLAASGFEPALLCEIDPIARAVLRARFPAVEICTDVTELEQLPAGTDLVTAGFPCQDLSSSGPKGGIEGLRSGLIGEVFRLVENSRPRWVLLENVHFMLHLSKGAAIAQIAANFEALGYSWAYRVLDSQGFGLPQRRRRVFILASLDGDPRDVLLTDQGSFEATAPSLDKPIGFYWTEGTYATGLAGDAVPPLKGGSTIGIPSPPAILLPDGLVGMPHVEDAEALQGFPRGWSVAAESVAKASYRWKLIGNAVPVNVALWVGSKLSRPGSYHASNDLPLDTKATWPDAAWGAGGERYRAQVGHYPRDVRSPSLAALLQHELRPLSVRAASGFLSRARKGRLRFPAGFLESVERHLHLAAAR
jgi:DNA-methyltransferase (dcm)